MDTHTVVLTVPWSPACSELAIPRNAYYGLNREDSVIVRPPGIERLVLAPDTVWYGRLKLLFTISIQSYLTKEVTKFDCAYISFWFEIKLDSSGIPGINAQ